HIRRGPALSKTRGTLPQRRRVLRVITEREGRRPKPGHLRSDEIIEKRIKVRRCCRDNGGGSGRPYAAEPGEYRDGRGGIRNRSQRLTAGVFHERRIVRLHEQQVPGAPHASRHLPPRYSNEFLVCHERLFA